MQQSTARYKNLHRIGNLFFFRHCSKVALLKMNLFSNDHHLIAGWHLPDEQPSWERQAPQRPQWSRPWEDKKTVDVCDRSQKKRLWTDWSLTRCSAFIHLGQSLLGDWSHGDNSRVHAHGERTLQQCLLARLFPLTRGCWHCRLCFTASLCLLPRPLLLHWHSKCKRQLRVVIGVDPKLKSAAASARDASATAILTL